MPKLVSDTEAAYFYRENAEGPWRVIRFLKKEDGTFFAATAAQPDAADEKIEHPAGSIEWTLYELSPKAWTVYDVEGRCTHFTINDTNTRLARYIKEGQNFAGPVISKEEITAHSKQKSSSQNHNIPDLSHLAAAPFPQAASILQQVKDQDTRETRHAEEQRKIAEKAARWSTFRRNDTFPVNEEKDDFSETLSSTLAFDLDNILHNPNRYETPEEAVAALDKIAKHFAWIEEVEPNFPDLRACGTLESTLSRSDDNPLIANLCPDYETIQGKNQCLLLKHQHVHNLIRRKIDAIHQRVLQSDELYPSVDLGMLEKNKTYHRIFSSNNPPLSEQIITAGEGLNDWLLTNKLLDSAAINRKDPTGSTMLHYAVLSANSETTILLTGNGASANIRNHAGQTPLHIAVTTGNLELVNILLDAGAQTGIQDNQGQTPLHVAIASGNINIANRLTAAAAASAQINLANPEGRTPLHIAMLHGNHGLAKTYINAGAHINIADNHGDSPLSLALQNGHRDAAEQLIRDPLNQNEFLNEFRKIYNALYQGQSGLFKSSFHNHPDIDSVFAYAREKPDSRTAKALELTAKYFKRDLPENEYTHPQLFRDIYAYAFSHGSWFGISNASGFRFWNFFTKPLQDNINYINPPAPDNESDTRSVKIGKALRG